MADDARGRGHPADVRYRPASLALSNRGRREAAESSEDIIYWARFENLLGERFEVRNPPEPTRPAEFRRLS